MAAICSGSCCLLARRLVEAGVSMIQVNLGRNEKWGTHGNTFPHLKDHLLPPMDHRLSALLDNPSQRGLLGRSSDRNGAFPASAPQTPENFAASFYDILAPRAEPIMGLRTN